MVMAIGLIARPQAAELKSETVAAFERYQRALEAAISADLPHDDRFLRTLTVDAARRAELERQVRNGQVAVRRMTVVDAGRGIDIPSGLVHHWVGAIFIPNVRAAEAVALMRDYDRHAEIFRPAVQRSKTLEQNGDHVRLFLRFYLKKVIAVTVNTESSGVFTTHAPGRVSSMIRSTRIAEVQNPGTPTEREYPVGNDGGYLWRLNTYWRYLERDGGVYVECESLTLTRGIPFGLRWIVGPFVASIPRELLTGTLETTRKQLAGTR
jgi:hypothetical protein